jgi:hypothetical protein
MKLQTHQHLIYIDGTIRTQIEKNKNKRSISPINKKTKIIYLSRKIIKDQVPSM